MSLGRPKKEGAVVCTPGSSLLKAATKMASSHDKLISKWIEPRGNTVTIPTSILFPIKRAPFSMKNPAWKDPFAMKLISVARGWVWGRFMLHALKKPTVIAMSCPISAGKFELVAETVLPPFPAETPVRADVKSKTKSESVSIAWRSNWEGAVLRRRISSILGLGAKVGGAVGALVGVSVGVAGGSLQPVWVQFWVKMETVRAVFPPHWKMKPAPVKVDREDNSRPKFCKAKTVSVLWARFQARMIWPVVG